MSAVAPFEPKPQSTNLLSHKALLAKRYRGRCYYCGVRMTATIPGERPAPTDFTKDHRTPRARGGSSVIANLVPSCRRCNGLKGDKTEFEFAGCVLERTFGWAMRMCAE